MNINHNGGPEGCAMRLLPLDDSAVTMNDSDVMMDDPDVTYNRADNNYKYL